GTIPEALHGVQRETNTMPTASSPGTGTAHKVVIVNGSPEMLGLLESVLDAGHYDLVFIESNEHAYSQIRKIRPHLVILCIRMDDMNGFQILSMLKLDDDTRDIPVLTYTMSFDDAEPQEEEPEPAEEQMFAPRPVLMN